MILYGEAPLVRGRQWLRLDQLHRLVTAVNGAFTTLSDQDLSPATGAGHPLAKQIRHVDPLLLLHFLAAALQGAGAWLGYQHLATALLALITFTGLCGHFCPSAI